MLFAMFFTVNKIASPGEFEVSAQKYSLSSRGSSSQRGIGQMRYAETTIAKGGLLLAKDRIFDFLESECFLPYVRHVSAEFYFCGVF